MLPHNMTAHQIIDEITRQSRLLPEHRLKPECVEISEPYVAQLDASFLRGDIVTIAVYESHAPAFGGVPIRRVQSPGHLRVVVV
jgi:hypothetical protein